jgi:hypothetical protein
VPGTGHDIRVELPFSERTAAVNAGVVDDMKLSIDVKNGQSLAIDFDDHAMSWLDVVDVRDAYELSHTPCLLARLTDP